MDAGQPLEVLEEFDSIVESMMVVAEKVSEITGLPLHGVQSIDAGMRHKSWLQRIWGR
jgi:hypothetical protein